MKFFKNIGWIFLLAPLIIVGCNKEEIGPQQTEEPSSISGSMAVVLNEGNFNFGNASISVVDSAGNVSNNVFLQSNEEPLGDVLQNAVQIEDQLYFVLNNSGKIVITNLDFEKVAEIGGLNSPRYILPLSGSKAYVSDLYSSDISIADLISNEVTGEISDIGWIEEMILTDGKVFAANQDLPGLTVIDPQTDEITGSIELEAAPSGMAIDANGFLWVVCTGGLSGDSPTLFKIDPLSDEVTSFLIEENVSGFLELNPAKDHLYFATKAGIIKMSVNASEVPSMAHLAVSDFLIYGLSVDPVTGDLWLMDAEDYVQNGTVHIFSPAASSLFSMQVGKLPNGALFIK